MMRYKRISTLGTEPVTLTEARAHLRLDTYDSPATHPDDTMVEGLITTAREWAERFMGRFVVRSIVEAVADEFPAARTTLGLWRPLCYEAPLPLYLLGAPVRALTFVRYLDAAGVTQTLTSYQLDDIGEPPRLLPAAGASWPATQDRAINAVRVRYEAGYSLPDESPDTDPLPKPIKQAILLLLGHLYENREDTSEMSVEEIPMGAQTLMRKYRLENGFA